MGGRSMGARSGGSSRPIRPHALLFPNSPSNGSLVRVGIRSYQLSRGLLFPVPKPGEGRESVASHLLAATQSEMDICRGHCSVIAKAGGSGGA